MCWCGFDVRFDVYGGRLCQTLVVMGADFGMVSSMRADMGAALAHQKEIFFSPSTVTDICVPLRLGSVVVLNLGAPLSRRDLWDLPLWRAERHWERKL